MQFIILNYKLSNRSIIFIFCCTLLYNTPFWKNSKKNEKSSWQSNLIMIIYILSIQKCVAGQWYRNRRSRMCKRINKSQESIWFSSRQRWKINIWKYIEWRVWSWLRMNADRMLNTCKSLAKLCLHSQAKADGWVTRKELAPQTGITDGNDW